LIPVLLAGILGIEMVDGHYWPVKQRFFKNRRKATLPKFSPENPLFS
jgi:hypothetical protein